jgi:hypothetical protein
MRTSNRCFYIDFWFCCSIDASKQPKSHLAFATIVMLTCVGGSNSKVVFLFLCRGEGIDIRGFNF